MPRTARFLKDKVCYHVIARGIPEGGIFPTDADYQHYCRLLKKYKERFAVYIFAFCLLPFAVHLVIHPRAARHLSLFIQRVNQAYAVYFNKKYKRTGRLWQGRFKSVVLERDGDLFDCIRYVEFHPVRSARAGSPVEYPWSSCTFRILGRAHNWLDTTIENRDQVWPISSSPTGPQKKKSTAGQTIPIKI